MWAASVPKSSASRSDAWACQGQLEVGRRPELAETSAWQVIWTVGGAVWVAVTCMALLWMLPWSGTRFAGDYVVSTLGQAVKHALVFLAAAPCYRVAISLGWPSTLAARGRVLLLNLLLAWAVLIWSVIADVLVTGAVDGRIDDMREKAQMLWGLFSRLDWWASLLRFFLIPYALGLCAVVLVIVVSRRHRESLRATELSRAYVATRLAMLSAQLQPHFLFNSLNALTELIEENPSRASALVVRLGDFLRHALEGGRAPWVKVSTEIEGLQTYFDIQRIRFGDGVQIALDVSPAALSAFVPSLILQPLVENAIEHGRGGHASPLALGLQISVREQRLRVAISNSSPSVRTTLTPSQYGRGLLNVEQRLDAAYGTAARLSIGPNPQGGTVATLDLPLLLTSGSGPVAS